MKGIAALSPLRSHGLPVAAVHAAVVLALLAAACSGRGSSTSSGSPSAGGSTTSASAVAVSVCMRSHGVPSFPDPTTDSNGPVFNITKAGISDGASHSRRFVATLDECARLVGGNAPESFE
jgi:hypothetical protein